MDVIGIDKVKTIANNKGLKPGKIKGTALVALTKGLNPRIEIIDWPAFEKGLATRGLAVYESGGWMKIMKAPAAA
ncbi:MAG: hypothetical protein J5485_03810 [Candidatus Methanomethylophilaceae archaeon]|nr:hypothetical protein [Candidatus Methanomethylophilaceae archaeon]